MIAVFSCEDSSTHTCWKACFKSTLLKTVHPTSRSLNEDNFGNGYLSSCVIVLTRRKSPHTRLDPSDFFTAGIGDAQLDSHRSMTLTRSHWSSCSSTWIFLSPCNFLHGVKIGGHPVTICSGVVMVTTLLRLTSVTSGKSFHNWLYSSSPLCIDTTELQLPASLYICSLHGVSENIDEIHEFTLNSCPVILSIKHRFSGSIRQRLPSSSWKKSIPTIERIMSAVIISCEHACPNSLKATNRRPNVDMRCPLAQYILYSVGLGFGLSSLVGGRTDTTETQSTK